MKKRIYLTDLAYYNKYSSSNLTIPLNIGYIGSYTQKLFPAEVEIRLFKDPNKLLEVSRINPPDILGLSCYYWNWHLDILITKLVKRINPECITVVGGPQVDTDIHEQLDLYRSFNGNLDFMIPNEGELGFAELTEKILSNGRKEKLFDEAIDGCIFTADKETLVEGEKIGLSLDLTTLPSPFTTGLLDEFLTAEYMPILQGSRMCPYSCAYCCSGKLKGRIRKFPDEVVKADIEYLAEKYSDYSYRTLYICDENFGINKRDSEIAEYLVETRDRLGFPRQTFCYFDKRFTETVKKSALLFGDMNSGGLQLAFQTFNADALNAVKRRNMSIDELKGAIHWAKDNGLTTSSDLIFGLPRETKETFLESLEFIMQSKIDRALIFNLLILKGQELNRRESRGEFHLRTKFRPSYGSGYELIGDQFVCESEEIVTSSSHFTFDDFMYIRKIMLFFYVVNQVEYFKKVFTFLVDHDQKTIPIFDALCNPSQKIKGVDGYHRFMEEFLADANAELYDTHEEVCAHLQDLYIKNGNQVASPIRINFHFTARLIYQECWFKKMIKQILNEVSLGEGSSIVLDDLIEISEEEWIDLGDPYLIKSVIVSGETLDYLNIPRPESATGKYRYRMSLSEPQRNIIESFNKQFHIGDEMYYYNALDYIHPRKYLRYEAIDVEPVTG